jgi:hypothetical protein
MGFGVVVFLFLSIVLTGYLRNSQMRVERPGTPWWTVGAALAMGAQSLSGSALSAFEAAAFLGGGMLLMLRGLYLDFRARSLRARNDRVGVPDEADPEKL